MKYHSTFKSLLLIMLAAMLPLAAGAYDFMLDGLCYNINDDGVTVTVTWEVQDTPSYNDLGEWGETVLSIPETVTYDNNTYTVTTIICIYNILCLRNCHL